MTTQTEVWSRVGGKFIVAKAVVRNEKGQFVGITNKTAEVLITK